jgi:hypothetical protein
MCTPVATWHHRGGVGGDSTKAPRLFPPEMAMKSSENWETNQQLTNILEYKHMRTSKKTYENGWEKHDIWIITHHHSGNIDSHSWACHGNVWEYYLTYSWRFNRCWGV